MQKIVSKYALAAHLALMAVAPLILLPFAGSAKTATVMLWLSAFGFIWLLMEPSRRKGEMPHDARARVGKAIVRDPVFWLSLVLVAYTGARMANAGIRMSYDAELMAWSIRQPSFPLLPGSVTGTGYLPFAVVVALAVILQGTRHALGRSARSAFMLVGALVSGLTAVALAFAISYAHPVVVALAQWSTNDATYFGTVFGIQTLCAAVALFGAVENKWVKAEPLAVLALVGNAIGLVAFAPPLTAVLFGGLFLVQIILSFVMARHVFEGSGSFRCALSVLMAIGATVMYAIGTSELPWMAAKIATVRGMTPFPEGFAALRDALSAIAMKAWKENPWLGTGLGTFSLDIRFLASPEDWEVIPSVQKTALNGWWQLLAERGVIGAGLMAVLVGMLLWFYVLRVIAAFRARNFSPELLVGPFVALALTALAFIDCSFLRPEILLLGGAFLSLSGGSLASRSAKGDNR